MARYTVDVDALDELRATMQAYLSSCEKSLHRVEALIGQVSQSWDGTASQSYQDRHRDWMHALRDMHAVLDDLRAWIAEADEAYRTVMAMNLRMAGQ